MRPTRGIRSTLCAALVSAAAAVGGTGCSPGSPETSTTSARAAPAELELEPALERYLELGEALAADDLPRARAGARALAAESPAAPWIEGFAGDADTLAELRARHHALSRRLIGELAPREPLHRPLMVVHCPHAFGRRGGLWVQRRGDVANPYEGARMLRCGDIVDWSRAHAQLATPD